MNRILPSMTLTEHILETARAYCAARGLSISRVSTIVFNDGKKLDLIASGRDLHTAKYEHAMAWFSENWPEDVDWPADVPRPEPARGAA
jgi:hypothetical protein